MSQQLIFLSFYMVFLWGGFSVLAVGQDITLKRIVIPSYPQTPSGVRQSGSVQVTVEIDQNGHVSDAYSGDGSYDLTSVAKTAVRQWQFVNASGMTQKVKIEFNFILKPGIGRNPAVASVIEPPYRVDIFAEYREPILLHSPVPKEP